MVIMINDYLPRRKVGVFSYGDIEAKVPTVIMIIEQINKWEYEHTIIIIYKLRSQRER